jgi:putative ABC transport system permease protein
LPRAFTEQTLQDLRFAVRTSGRRPAFTAVVTLTLALGIGVNAALFSVVHSVLLQALPFQAPERLVSIGETNPGWSTTLVSGAAFFEWRNRSDCFEKMALTNWWDVNLETGAEPQVVRSSIVTSDYFDLLGVKPVAGRTFLPGEYVRGGPRVVLLSHALWTRLGARHDLVGTSIRIDGEPRLVAGIMPPVVYSGPFIGWGDIWSPATIDESVAKRSARRWRGWRALARLKDRVTIEQARSQLEFIHARLALEDSVTYGGYRVIVAPLHEFVTGNVRIALLVLLAAVGLVLLIACVNIANLLLARAASREKEIAIRMAQGASRGRLIRQMLIESLVFSLGGAIGGLLLAQAMVRAIVRFSPADLPRIQGAAVDGRVVLFALGLALTTTILFGLAPAFAVSRASVADSLRAGARTTATGRVRGRVKSVLVTAEIALALVLLVTSGLVGRSFVRLLDADAGFVRKGVLTFELMLPLSRYKDDSQRTVFLRELLRRLEALRGVVAAGANRYFPLHERQYSNPVFIEGRPVPDGQEPVVQYGGITSGYLRAMSIPLHAGRGFTEQEMWERPGTALINESMAQRLWPGQNPLGRRIKHTVDGQWLTIIGVVGDVKQRGLALEAYPQIYVPYSDYRHNIMSFAVRATVDAGSLIAPIRREVANLDPSLPLARLMPLEEAVERTEAGRRLAMLLLALFAALALILASVGLYGVISYVVAQRTNEIGIRMALGARPADVLTNVMGHGLRLVAAGLLIGIAVSLATSRLISTLLYGVAATDLTTYGAVSFLLLVVAAAACYVPARRATRIDPLEALRQEQ